MAGVRFTSKNKNRGYQAVTLGGGANRITAGIISSKGKFVSGKVLKEQFDLNDFLTGIITGSNEIQLRKAARGGNDTLPQVSRELNDSDATGSGWSKTVEPPYSFPTLTRLLEVCDMHDACIQTKAHDYAYHGWFLEDAPELKHSNVPAKDVEAARLEVTTFLEHCVGDDRGDIASLVRDVAIYWEATGSSPFEIMRDRRGFISSFNHIPMDDVVALRDYQTRTPKTAHFKQTKGYSTRYFAGFNDNVKFNGFDPLTATLDKFPPYGQREQAVGLNPPFLHYGKEGEYVRDFASAATEMILLTRSPKMKSTVYGTPAAYSAMLPILGSMKADAFNLAFFDSYGVPQYAVVMRGLQGSSGASTALTDDDALDAVANNASIIEEYFQEFVATGDRRGVLFLQAYGEAEIEFIPLSANENLDQSFTTYTTSTRDRIRIAHRVPPAAVGIHETANLGSGRDTVQLMRYREHTVTPGQRYYASWVNRLIRCGLLISYFNFQFRPMPVDDEIALRKLRLDEYERGGLSPNEYRRETGRASFTDPEKGEDAGDSLYIRNAQIAVVSPKGGLMTTMPGEKGGNLDALAAQATQKPDETQPKE